VAVTGEIPGDCYGSFPTLVRAPNEQLQAARGLANEAHLAALLIQLEALELRYRLLLDAHQLWVKDLQRFRLRTAIPGYPRS
jgi:hypothetical protein